MSEEKKKRRDPVTWAFVAMFTLLAAGAVWIGIESGKRINAEKKYLEESTARYSEAIAFNEKIEVLRANNTGAETRLSMLRAFYISEINKRDKFIFDVKKLLSDIITILEEQDCPGPVYMKLKELESCMNRAGELLVDK